MSSDFFHQEKFVGRLLAHAVMNFTSNTVKRSIERDVDLHVLNECLIKVDTI